jgi:SAM-dependent methyltransferase
MPDNPLVPSSNRSGSVAGNEPATPFSDPDRLLRESAPLALERASWLCHRGPEGHDACDWYHGVWQYFRLLGVVATPWMQRRFYERVLGELAAAGSHPRVLVSGASDYAMLALVLHAYAMRGAQPEVTVTDRCETPLFLNRWYAERHGVPIDTRAGDILEAGGGSYDVICTHSFLGNFPPQRREELLSVWRRLLRPGGKLVTINRIRPGCTDEVRFSAGQGKAFRERVLRADEALPVALGIDARTLVRWADEYQARYNSWPIASAAELHALLERSGFVVERLEPGPGAAPGPSGPSVAGAALRLEVVASRGA